MNLDPARVISECASMRRRWKGEQRVIDLVEMLESVATRLAKAEGTLASSIVIPQATDLSDIREALFEGLYRRAKAELEDDGMTWTVDIDPSCQPILVDVTDVLSNHPSEGIKRVPFPLVAKTKDDRLLETRGVGVWNGTEHYLLGRTVFEYEATG